MGAPNGNGTVQTAIFDTSSKRLGLDVSGAPSATLSVGGTTGNFTVNGTTGLVSTIGGYVTTAAAPATNHAAGATGELRADATYVYYCSNGGTDDGSTVRWQRLAWGAQVAW